MIPTILIIAFSMNTKYAVFDITRFNSMEECQAARTEILETVNPPKDSWLPDSIPSDTITCKEIGNK